MNNPQSYINHQLNTSKTKKTYKFSIKSRFDNLKKQYEDRMYTLPSTICRRSCSFGFGQKKAFIIQQHSPPPGRYESLSEFSNQKKNNTISMSIGREEVKFGSFLAQSHKKRLDPSPNAYNIRAQYSKRGGRMAAKLPTQIDLKIKNKSPGPGKYDLDTIQIKNSGSYILSTYKNNISPQYHNPTHNHSRSKTESLGPGAYQLTQQDFGKSILSKFKNSVTGSFNKQKRKSLADRSKLGFPGFKYKKFSQFGNN